MKQAEFRCKWIRREDICQCAEGIRNQYWPSGKLPVDMEHIIESDLKLYIDPKPGLLQATDMEAYLQSDLEGIVVDYDHYMDERFANRMRFSFAHELGHFFLHKSFYSTVAYESAEEWKDVILSMPDTEHRNFEFQANEFAGRLLVPLANLIYEIEVSIETLRRINMLEYLKNDTDAVLSLISTQLAKPFGVSTDVIETRAKREGLWPPEVK